MNSLGARKPSTFSLGLVLVAALALLLVAPTGLSYSLGIHSDNANNPDFEAKGCLACHGDASHAFGALGSTPATYTLEFVHQETGEVLSGAYEHGAVYEVNIALNEQSGVGENNKAGFNIRASAGTFEGVDGQSQIDSDGSEATHVAADRTSWQVLYTAPEEGPIVIDLWLNDVNGDGAPGAEDYVYRVGAWFTDKEGPVPGSVEEHEPHVGVELPQYWVGLIALAATFVVILFTFFYIKYSSPHNATKKDR